jgi:hypothetical protein
MWCAPSLPAQRLDAAQTVRSYQQLARLERSFRILKRVTWRFDPSTTALPITSAPMS